MAVTSLVPTGLLTKQTGNKLSYLLVALVAYCAKYCLRGSSCCTARVVGQVSSGKTREVMGFNHTDLSIHIERVTFLRPVMYRPKMGRVKARKLRVKSKIFLFSKMVLDYGNRSADICLVV